MRPLTHLSARQHIKRFLSVALLFTIVGTLIGESPHGVIAQSAGQVAWPLPVPDAALPIGADVWNLDEDNQQYTKEDAGLVRARLYNAPVGVPNKAGWAFRNLHLVQDTNGSWNTQPNVPFGLRLAPTSDDPALAQMRNEDGVMLGLGLAMINNSTPATVKGRSTGTAVVYQGIAAMTSTNSESASNSVSASGVALTLEATSEGLDVQATIGAVTQVRSLAFTLVPDARTQLIQDASGTIRVTRAITTYADDGQPGVITQTEFIVSSPFVRDAGMQPASNGPVTVALAPLPNGRFSLTLSLDNGWLSDPARTFPIRVDLPIATDLSAMHSGWFGTVNSCAPTSVASQAEVEVGTDGHCAYHGVLSFDTASIPSTMSIASARLLLYTPDQTNLTGVQVFQDTPPQGLPSLQRLAGGDSHVTSGMPLALQQVIEQLHAPRVRAQLLDELRHWKAGTSLPPLLQQLADLLPQAEYNMEAQGVAALKRPISWQLPTWSTAPAVSDGTAGVMQLGSAGHWQSWDVSDIVRQWVQDASTNNGFTLLSASAPVSFASPLGSGDDDPTHAPYLEVTYGPQLAVPSSTGSFMYGVSARDFVPSCSSICSDPSGGVQVGVQGAVSLLNAGYIRMQAVLDCNGNFPGQTTNLQGQLAQAGQNGSSAAIVDLVPNANCLGLGYWFTGVLAFVANLATYYHGSGVLYIEAGNEPNVHQNQYNDGTSYDYPLYEAYVAVLISLFSYSWAFPYQLISAGMANPTTFSFCQDPYGTYNAFDAFFGVLYSSYFVPLSLLDVGLHPYSYNSNESDQYGYALYWENYYGQPGQPGMVPPYGFSTYGGNHYAGSCEDIGSMWALWTILFPENSIVLTEDNWNSGILNSPPNYGNCHTDLTSASNGCPGTYLADFMTYFVDKGWSVRYPPTIAAWFTTVDFQSTTLPGLGLYNQSGGSKLLTIFICPDNTSLLGSNIPMNKIYSTLANGGICY